MNKDQIIKNAWKKIVRLRPLPRRFDGGPDGPELEQIDRDWSIHDVSPKDGVHISCSATGHGFTLNWDNIREYSTDPSRGEHYGFLLLKIQLFIGGPGIWIEPFVENPRI